MGVIQAFDGAGTVTYNGISSDSLGIYVERFPDHQYPERDYLVQHVPGRSGDIVIDQGSYKNVDRSYDLVVASDTLGGFSGVASALIGWLHRGSGYYRLTDSYEPDVYRLAMYKESGNVRNILSQAGRAVVTFNCKPQCFLTSGEAAISLVSSGSGTETTYTTQVTNPTLFEALPVIQIKWATSATDSVTVTVGANNWGIVGSHGQGSTMIDSPLQDCHSAAGFNYNSRIVFNTTNNFPVLAPNSTTTITVTGSANIEYVKVTPNWWRL